MSMRKKVVLLFFTILFIGILLRTYRVTGTPPGVNRDEASIGYTAYSLLFTGKDEYAKSYPISFQSFGDWKLPLYIYATIPAVKFLGLNELAVRVVSILVGITTIILSYLFVKELFKKESLALLTMFLVAVSPWHVHLSRVESESNTAVFLITLSALLFLKALRGKHILIVLSAIFAALTYYTYAGNYVFTTLLVCGVLFLYRKSIPKNKYSFIALLLFVALSGFIFSKTVFEANKTKLSGIGIFGDPSVVHAKVEIPRNQHEGFLLFTRVVHNRVTFAVERIAQNYLNSFSPQFLFITGGTNKAHNIEGFGNMYIFESIFLLAGFIYLVTAKKTKETKLVLWWFLIAPIAAIITKDAPHTNRMFVIFPILPLVVSMGLYWVIAELIKQRWKKLAIFIILFLFIINFAIYIDRYYIHFPINEEKNWGIGYKKLNEVLSKPSNSSKKVIMSRPQYSPYIYILFYSKHNPSFYQKEALRYPPTNDGFVNVKGFGRYEFRTIDWGKDIQIPNVLLVDWSDQVPLSIKEAFHTQDIILSNSESMFTIVETK